MAKAQTIELESGDDGPLIEGQDAIELDILNELRAAPEDETWTMNVSRVLGAAKDGIKEPFLFEGDAVALEGIHTRLRDEHGTGRYRVRIVRNKRLYRRFDICVEAPIKKSDAAPVAMPRSELAEFVAALQRSNEALLERLIERGTAAPPAAVDPLAMFERAVKVIADLRPATPAPAADQGSTFIAAFKSAVELISSMNERDSAGGESNMIDLVRDLIKSPLLARIVEQPAIPGATPTAIPATPPRTTVITPPAASPPNKDATQPQQPMPPLNDQQVMAMIAQNPQLQARLKGAVEYLLKHAKRNSDVGAYADWVVENWEPEFIDLLLRQPQWFQLVCMFAPDAASYKSWFDQLVAEIRAIVNSDSGDGASDHANGKDPSPIVSNGNPGWESGGSDDVEIDGEFN